MHTKECWLELSDGLLYVYPHHLPDSHCMWESSHRIRKYILQLSLTFLRSLFCGKQWQRKTKIFHRSCETMVNCTVHDIYDDMSISGNPILGSLSSLIIPRLGIVYQWISNPRVLFTKADDGIWECRWGIAN